MESFWGSLKNELVHHRRFTTRTQARQEITEYIECWHRLKSDRAFRLKFDQD